MVASAHHISVGYLHLLFAAEGASVSRWIKGRDAAAFSRAFRTAYGVSPREYRLRTLGMGLQTPAPKAAATNRPDALVHRAVNRRLSFCLADEVPDDYSVSVGTAESHETHSPRAGCMRLYAGRQQAVHQEASRLALPGTQ